MTSRLDSPPGLLQFCASISHSETLRAHWAQKKYELTLPDGVQKDCPSCALKFGICWSFASLHSQNWLKKEDTSRRPLALIVICLPSADGGVPPMH
eukprot:1161009-Pelagomonas_calceolata.AAC.7